MKILLDDLKIENPFGNSPIELYCAFNDGQQSILSQLKDVDMDEIARKYNAYRESDEYMKKLCQGIAIPFSQFLKEYVK